MAGQSRDEQVNFIYAVTGSEEVAASAAAMLKVADAGENASVEVRNFAEALKTAQTQASLANQALAQKAGLSEITAELAAAKDAYGKLNAQLIITGDTSKKAASALTAAGKSVDDLTVKQNLATVALTKTENALNKTGGDATNLAGSLTKANAAGAQAAKGLASIGDAAAKAADGTKKTADATKNLGDESSKSSGLLEELKSHLLAIVSVATAVELALKGIEFGKDAIGEAAGVEQTLSRIKGTAQGAAEQFGQLDEAITKAARAANVSNEAAASAALALAQQGQTAEQIFQTLLPTILLAKDANIDYAASAKIVDDILDLFGKDASEAGDAVDKLVVASKGSKEGLQGMAAAISGLAPDAKQLGLTFDDLVGTLGFLQQNGIDASKAVRGLRTVFQDLENPASAFTQALANAGDTSQDFAKAIATIRDGGQKGQDALLKLSGAARSLVAFLAQQAPDAVEKFTAALGNADGAAQSLQKTFDDNLSGSFTGFEHALDNIAEKLATPVLKPLSDEFVKLAGQLNAFADSDQFAALAAKFGELATNIVTAFDGIIGGIDWKSLQADATSAIDGAAKSVKSLADNAEAAATAVNKIGAVIGVPFRAVAVVFDLVKTSIAGLTAGLTTLTAGVSGFVDRLVGHETVVTRVLESIKEGAKDAADNGIGALRDNSDALVDNLVEVAGAGKDAGEGITQTGDAAAKAAAPVQAIGEGAAEATTNVAALGEVGPGVFENTAAAANKAAAAVVEHNKAITDARAKVDETRKALDELVKSGNGSAEAMLLAKKAYDDAQGSLDKLTGKTNDATDAQKKLAIAFAGLHITSQKELEEAATAAKSNLDLITQAFQNNGAKIEDVRRAYEAYAASVRAAFSQSDASVRAQQEENLALLASTLGINTGFKGAGDSAEDFGRRGKAAIDAVGDSAKKTGKAISDASQETKDWAQKIDDFNSSSQAWGDQLAAAATKAASALEGITIQTNDQLRLLREARDEWLSGAISGEEYARRISVALGGVDTELQKQTEALQKFNDELNSLQSDLASANGDDATVENLRHQKKLDDIKAETDLSISQRQKLEQLEEQIHEANLKRIKQENDARNNGNQSGGGTDTGGGSGTGPGGGTDTGGGGGIQAPRAPTQPQAPTLHIEIKADTIIGGTQKQIADQLARLILPALNSIQRRSG